MSLHVGGSCRGDQEGKFNLAFRVNLSAESPQTADSQLGMQLFCKPGFRCDEEGASTAAHLFV